MSLNALLKKRLGTVIVCSVLQFGALMGAPMRPEEIREFLNRMNQPKLAHVLPSETDESGDDP